MSIKNFILNFYGFFMGTTTQYLKLSRKNWPNVELKKISEHAWIHYGGVGSGLVVRTSSGIILVDCHMQSATEDLIQKMTLEFHLSTLEVCEQVKTLFLTHAHRDVSEGVGRFKQPHIYLPQTSAEVLKQEHPLGFPNFTAVTNPKPLTIDSTTWQLIPVGAAHSFSDMVIVFADSKPADSVDRALVSSTAGSSVNFSVVVMGDLFYHQVHPVMHKIQGLNIALWIQALENILQKFPNAQFLAGESITPGQLCTAQDVRSFQKYLKDLNNPEVEFSYMRQNYNWEEIPAFTSLEENFDTAHNVGAGTLVAR